MSRKYSCKLLNLGSRKCSNYQLESFFRSLLDCSLPRISLRRSAVDALQIAYQINLLNLWKSDLVKTRGLLIAWPIFDSQDQERDAILGGLSMEMQRRVWKTIDPLRLLFARNSPPDWRRTCGFPYHQLRFHGVLVVKFGTWAVNALQQDFSSGPSHFAQRLAHGG